MKIRLLVCAAALLIGLLAHVHDEQLSAYALLGLKWPTPAATVYVDFGNSQWNTSFEDAMALWNQSTVFKYSINHTHWDPCANPTTAGVVRNGAGFSTTYCGDDWPALVLAITTNWSQGGNRIQGGVAFNKKWNWSVYNGPWGTGANAGLQDFHRVAVHELGHLIGLNHEDHVPAIMATSQFNGSTIIYPQPDDINGVNFLYGGATQIAPPPLLSPADNSTVGSSTVPLIWLPANGAESYDVYVGSSNPPPFYVNTTGTTVTVQSMTPGRYYWQVVSKAGSSSVPSSVASFVVTAFLAAPTLLSPANNSTVSNGTVTLNWLSISGATSYDVYFGPTDTPVLYTNTANTAITIQSLASGTYYWKVASKTGSTSSTSTVSAFTVKLGGSSITASPYHVFPQFVDGYLSDGSDYRSTLIVTNIGATQNCTIRLYGLTTNESSVFPFMLTGVYVFATNGTQSFQRGYATLQCSSNVEAQLLYSLYGQAGMKLSEATVFSSPSATSLRIVDDERGSSYLGLAIANDTDQNASYAIRIYDASGKQISAPVLTLGPRQSRAAFLDQLADVPSGHFGLVDVIASSGTASMIGLRFTGNVFTTIPASMLVPAGVSRNTYHVFPQFVDGRLSDGTNYRSSLIVTNIGATQNCTIRLYGLTTNGSSVLPLTLTGAYVFTTDGTQSFQQGYATLQCASNVEAQLLYSLYAPDGTKLSEATVFSSPPAASFRIIDDARGGSHLGLALANDSDQNASYTMRIYDSSGAQISAPTLTLGPRQSRAAFLDQLADIPSGHFGLVDVTANSGTASMIGLRFTGSVFTTIPANMR